MLTRPYKINDLPDGLYSRLLKESADRKFYRDDNRTIQAIIIEALDRGLSEIEREKEGGVVIE